MTVCTFYLQNKCRYGENCKFEHPRGGGGGGAQRNLFGAGGSQKVTFRDSFGNANNHNNNGSNNQFKWNSGQQSQGGLNTSQSLPADLVNGLPKEMDAWEKTRMWPFSCVSVEKELPCLPEFHDISVEEVRFEAYGAQKSGTMQAFNQKLQGLAQEYQSKRNQLRTMSMDVKQKLTSFIEDARRKKGASSLSMSMTTSSVFGASSTSNQGLFGKSTATAGLFGSVSNGNSTELFGKSAASSSTLFGSPASGFGTVTHTTSSVFGTPQGTNPAGSGLFGASGGNSLFGGGTGQGSVTPVQPASSGLFGGGQQTATTPGLFGSANTNAMPSTLFGKPVAGQQQNATSSVFGSFGGGSGTTSTPGTGLFGKPSTQPTAAIGGGGLFGSSNPASTPVGLFGSQPQSNVGAAPSGIFGALGSSPAPATGLFGKPAPSAGGGLFGNQSSASTATGGLLPTPNASSTGAGLFGKPPDLGASTPSMGFGLFGANAQQGHASPAQQGSVFGAGSSSTPAMGDSSQNASRCFSRMEELSQQDIEAFKAESFSLGNIPIKPPPKELVVL